MRAVLVGADLMYRKDGSLAPVEINTNVGWDKFNRVELEKDIFDFEDIRNFVEAHDINKIALQGQAAVSSRYLVNFFKDFNIEIFMCSEGDYDNLAQEEHTLAIRSFYDDEALVDSFCRDKINFLESIKNTNIGCEYLLKEEGGFKGEITKLEDSGVFPNFILKYRYPQYDKHEYPKFFRFTSLEQLYAFAESDAMQEDFFLMPFYYNPDKLYNGERIKLLRHWSIFVANEGELEPLYYGKYTKVCGKIDESKIVWNEDGSENGNFRDMLLTTGWYETSISGNLLADEDDLVWMADGTWKEARNLTIGDVVKTVKFPDTGVDITKHSEVDYNITVPELEEQSSYETANIVNVSRYEGFVDTVRMTFTDGTDWYDTAVSSYTVLDPEDGTVMFRILKKLKVGDIVVLLENTDALSPIYTEKEIAEIEILREEHEYVGLSCDNTHLFLSKASEDAASYVAIEHNDLVTFAEAHANRTCGSLIRGPKYSDGCTDGPGCSTFEQQNRDCQPGYVHDCFVDIQSQVVATLTYDCTK